MTRGRARRSGRLFADATLRGLLCAAIVLVGCAQERIRDDAQAALSAGSFEQAIDLYQNGLKEYPESSLLRSGLIQARLEVQARMLANAGALRAAGKLEEARKELDRARTLDPQNTRIAALIDELAVEQRQAAALADAEKLAANGKPDAALRLIACAVS